MSPEQNNPDSSREALGAFYRSPRGHLVRLLLTQSLERVLKATRPHPSDQRVAAALGYPRPYMNVLKKVAAHHLILQFSGYDIRPWPDGKPGRIAEVNETTLPLSTASLDVVLLVHGLESAISPHALLDEIWRLLKGGGRLYAILPNRRGFWASNETTPFGHGQPYSRSQIRDMLTDHGFRSCSIRPALSLPPLRMPFYRRLALSAERISVPFGGVLVVEAEKMIYSVRPITQRAWRVRASTVTGIARPSIGDMR